MQGIAHRGLNVKQACTLAFIAYNKIHIVTIIAFDVIVSSVTILINIDLVIQVFIFCIQDYD